MTLLYPDCSNQNWGGPNWTPQGEQELLAFLAQLHAEGFSGIVHKVSEGGYFQDPYWQACRSWCEQNDLSWLGYQYCTTDPPASQVRMFVENDGGTNVMLDFENGAGYIDNMWALVNAFNAAGINVSMLYLPHWYWGNIYEPDLSALTANQISLVSSAYPGGTGTAQDIYAGAGGDGGEGWAVYGGCAPSCWQFTDRATIGGLTVDCNAYRGANLDALFTGNVF